MKRIFTIKEISKDKALELIQRYHYSNTLPRLNKYFLGVFEAGRLVGCLTLGWGTRPKHTIQKLFPSLDSSDYLEIGRMCMLDEMPRNSESQMLAAVIRWIKANLPEIKVLFTWADGMLGKCGYVYQAANFLYVGASQTDIYLKDGYKIHPRQTKNIFGNGPDDTRKTVRPTVVQMEQYKVDHYRGNQYKYLYFTCSRTVKKKLLKEAAFTVQPAPKEDSLSWEKYDTRTRTWQPCGMPPYRTDFSQNINNSDIMDLFRREKVG